MSWNRILKYFLIWQAGIIIITGAASLFFPLRIQYLGGNLQNFTRNPWLYSRANFDGLHYIEIAKRGYGYAQQAFFPLYPELIRHLKPLFADHASAGVFISSISFIIALYFLVKLILLDHSLSVAKWTLIALLVFPTSFYFTAVYTEGLYFLLSVTAFYFARRRHWVLAGILGMLAANSRIIGVFLFPALLFEVITYLRAQKARLIEYVRTALPLLLIPFGLFSYMQYLVQSQNDALAFIHVQRLFQQGRSEKIILLYQVFWRYIKMAITVNRKDPLYLTVMLEFASGIMLSALSFLSLLKQRWSYAFYAIMAFVLPTLTGTFTSVPRYAIVIFPVFIFIGQWLSKSSRKVQIAYLLVNISLMVLYLSMFVRGYWVS